MSTENVKTRLIQTIAPNVITSESESRSTLIDPSKNIALFVGEFERGPVNEPIVVSSALEFKTTFGRAIAPFIDDWYQCYNYLQYSKPLIVYRVTGANSTKSNNNGIRANTVGGWGDLLTVKIQNDTTGLDLSIIEKEYQVLIYRKDILVEHLQFNIDDDLENFESNYIESVILENGTYQLQGGYTKPASYDDVEEAYSIFTKENFEIDIIIGNSRYNELAIQLAEYRRDCIAFVSIPPEFFYFLQIKSNNDDSSNGILSTEEYDDSLHTVQIVETSDSGYLSEESTTPIVIKISEESNTVYSENILIDIKKLFKLDNKSRNLIDSYVDSLPKSEFCLFVLGLKYIKDGFTDKNILVSVSGDIAGIKAMNSITNPWGTCAGYKYNIKSNYIDIRYFHNKNDIDYYYKKGVNSLRKNYLLSDKMFVDYESLADNLYLRNTLNYIERATEKLNRKMVFEENTLQKRGAIAREMKVILDDILASGGITGARVNVTKSDNLKEIIINVIIKFNNRVETVKLNMINSGTNEFSSILTLE